MADATPSSISPSRFMAKRFRLTWNLSTSWFGKQHQNASAFSRYLAAGKWISLFLVTLLLSLSCSGLGTVNAASTLQPPLSTAGAQIVDATGRAVLLRGVNWFGMETDLQAPHGLWARDYKAMLAQIRNLGYNMIRLPYSVQGLRASTISGVDFSIGSNRDLQNKTPLAVMDVIIQEAQRQGLLVLLDSHRLNNQRIPELWYGDGFTEADWIDTWKLLATRYKTQPNVIGADLKNEPHGRASWGTNDLATDWRLAAERAGNAILAINPDWLIVVEGVEKNVPGQQLAVHWQGGNLEGVKRFPVRLRNPRKLVYSPHEYGPGVFNQGWFNEPTFPQNLLNRWETGFYYIARQKIAPILIGEFGGRQVDRTSKEGIWQRQLVDYIQQQNLSFAYWSWNPNSSDTGGILLDDWNTVDQPKQQLLSPLLPAPGLPMTATQPNPLPSPLPTSPPSASPKPQPTPSPQPSSPLQPLPSPAPPASGNTLKLETKLQSDWQTGFCIAMQVTNQGKTASGNWRLTFQMNQAAIASSWNGTFNRQGTFYTVIPPDWGRTLQPGQVVDMGFCATKLGADYQPKQLLIANP